MWCDDVEHVLKNLLENCNRLAQIHKARYRELRHQLFLMRLPCIIVSTINSVLALGLTAWTTQENTSVVNAVLSLFCSVLGAIELFMQIAAKSQAELVTYRALSVLAIRIASTLKLERDHRSEGGVIFLKSALLEYESIFESSLVVKDSSDDLLETTVQASSPLRH